MSSEGTQFVVDEPVARYGRVDGLVVYTCVRTESQMFGELEALSRSGSICTQAVP